MEREEQYLSKEVLVQMRFKRSQFMTSPQGMSDEFRCVLIDLWPLNYTVYSTN